MSGEYAKVNPNVEQVLFKPEAARVNQQIIYLNELLPSMRPSEAAALVASSIAAMAYVILETNDVDTAKEIFTGIVDEAYLQRAHVATEKMQ